MRRLPSLLLLAVLALPLSLLAEPGDVDGAHDYAGIARMPGFLITDYDEDNPSEFDFPVARPVPTDMAHVETTHVKGHRYVIRYELRPGAAPYSLLQIQQFFEKLTADAGFTAEKTGAIGDVTETFHLKKNGGDVWIYLLPSMGAHILTIIEARPPLLSSAFNQGPEDPLYTALLKDNRVVLPVTFLPGKFDLGQEKQPIMERAIKMLQRHPELLLRIEGHTDNTGSATENQRLSAGRAQAVQAALIAGGVDKDQVKAVGLGGLEPLADNSTAAGREKNRRIELVIRQESPSFHAAAPNGTNYYPKTSP